MELTIAQNSFLVFELFVALACLAYVATLAVSLWKGAPFVPSKKEDVNSILHSLDLKKGMNFLELGCGDGRVVCEAVKKYGVNGRGVDVGWIWVLCARLRARLMNISQKTSFFVEDIRHTDVAWADVVYIYMMPRFLENNAEKIFGKCRPGTIIISYVFDISFLKNKEISLTPKADSYFVYKT